MSFLSNKTLAPVQLYDLIVKPLDVLRPLVQIGLMNMQKAQSTIENVTFNYFWKNQEKFVADDLNKCKKTAWLLPDYQGQKLSRVLYK